MVAAVSTGNVLGVDPTRTFTIGASTPEYPGSSFALGTTATTDSGGKIMFVQAGPALPLGAVCVINPLTNVATPITTALGAGMSGSKIGVAAQVPFAAGDYGWLQVDGTAPAVSVAASTAAFAQLYTSATAGVLTSATGGLAINGLILATAQGSGGAGVQTGLLNNPELVLTT